MNCSTPGLPVHHQLPEFTQTHVHRVGDAIQPSYPLSSPSPPAPNPSQNQNFSNESTLHMRWPKYWSFSFSISPSSDHPGLLKEGLVGSSWSPRDSQESSPWPQFESINSLALSLLCGPTLISVYDYWKNHSYDNTDFCKVMSLFFNTLSRSVIVFFPKSKCLLISWLLSLSTVILEPRKIKCHCFYIFPFYLTWSGGTGCHNLRFF